MILGAWGTVGSYQNQAQSQREIAAWEKRNPHDQYSDIVDFEATDPRPFRHEGSAAPIVFSLVAAVALAMAGRGARYVLANE